MRIIRFHVAFAVIISIFLIFCSHTYAWYDETHIAIAKAAGYKKWYNATGADLAKLKAGKVEGHNHFSNNPRGTVVTAQRVLTQTKRYNQIDPSGHLYGAIVGSIRQYFETTRKGKYAEYHLAYCAHYVGDLSVPLHNTEYNAFNRKYHLVVDATVNDEVLENLDKIRIYPITIGSEQDLAKEIARIATLSLNLGYKLEDESRVLTKEEAYFQLGHSASLFRAIIKYVEEND